MILLVQLLKKIKVRQIVIKWELKSYSPNALLYYSEYNLHMYAWYLTGWAYEKDYSEISKAAKQSKDAYIVGNFL